MCGVGQHSSDCKVLALGMAIGQGGLGVHGIRMVVWMKVPGGHVESEAAGQGALS